MDESKQVRHNRKKFAHDFVNANSFEETSKDVYFNYQQDLNAMHQ